MIEIFLCMAMFVLVFALFLCYAQNRHMYFKQNQLIESLMQDKRMLDWADKVGHYDVRCSSCRDELRSAMEEANA